MKIYILGASGMLGSKLFTEFLKNPKHKIKGSVRKIPKKFKPFSKFIDKNTDERVNRKFKEQEQQRELEINKRKAERLEKLFNYKLETFEVEDIKESKNRILKSKLRRAKSIPEVNLYAIMIIQDKLENDKETE